MTTGDGEVGNMERGRGEACYIDCACDISNSINCLRLGKLGVVEQAGHAFVCYHSQYEKVLLRDSIEHFDEALYFVVCVLVANQYKRY